MFNAQDRLNWRTHYGGTSGDIGKCIVANGTKVLIAGDTQSADIVTVNGGSNAWNEAHSGSWGGDCFIAEFNLSGAQQWGSCYAGSQGSLLLHGKGLALDPTTGDVVMSGLGSTTTLPIVTGLGWYNEDPTSSFLARFSGADRSLAWSTYLTGSHGQDSRVVIFDAIGNLYVSGLTSDLGFPVTPLNGMYINETPIPDVSYFDPDGPALIIENVDMYVMCFTPDHWLAWSTYFGGEAGSSYEGLYTLLHRNGDLYAAGFTTKSIVHWVGPFFESYFPLHDTQVPGVHFEENYSDVPNFDGLPTTDAFITRFCASPLTFVPERVNQTETALHAWQQGGQITISGLPIGRHRVMVSDAAGRFVGQLTATSDGHHGVMQALPWAEGSYVLLFPDLRMHARLFISR